MEYSNNRALCQLGQHRKLSTLKNSSLWIKDKAHSESSTTVAPKEV